MLDLFKQPREPWHHTSTFCKNTWDVIISANSNNGLSLTINKLTSNPAEISKLVFSIRNFDEELGSKNAYDELITVDDAEHISDIPIITRAKLESASALGNHVNSLSASISYPLSVSWNKYIIQGASKFSLDVTCPTSDDDILSDWLEAPQVPQVPQVFQPRSSGLPVGKAVHLNALEQFRGHARPATFQLNFCQLDWSVIIRQSVFGDNDLTLSIFRSDVIAKDNRKIVNVSVQIRNFNVADDNSENAYDNLVSRTINDKYLAQVPIIAYEELTSSLKKYVSEDEFSLFMIDVHCDSPASDEGVPQRFALPKPTIPSILAQPAQPAKSVTPLHFAPLKFNALELFQDNAAPFKSTLNFCDIDYDIEIEHSTLHKLNKLIFKNELLLSMHRKDEFRRISRDIVNVSVQIRNNDVADEQSANAYDELITEKNDSFFVSLLPFIEYDKLMSPSQTSSGSKYISDNLSTIRIGVQCESP